MAIVPLISIVWGALLLTMGKRLYWLFVAGAGFLLGIAVARGVLSGLSDTTVLIFGAVGAVFGAILVGVIQRTILGVAGFFAAAGGTYLLLQTVDLGLGNFWWVACLLAGLVGIGLMRGLFDFGLVLVSSYAGANLILTGARALGPSNIILPAAASWIALVVLILIGIGAQQQKRS